jgi:uncharacterized membrane protein
MDWLERMFALTCHQLPERSPQFAGVVFPICFRLAGLYFGVFASYVYLGMTGGWRRQLPTSSGIAVPVALLPFLVDGWGNTLHLWLSSDAVRGLTGLGAGIVLPLLLVPLGARHSATSLNGGRPTLCHLADAMRPALLGIVPLMLLLHPGSVLLFRGLALLAAAAFVLLTLNLIWAARPAVWRSSPQVVVLHE